MSGRGVLVVDDERDIADLLGYVLAKEGLTVYCASSVQEALLILTEFPVELVLTDFMMPGLDGAELLRTIRATLETAHVPVLVISALPEEAVRQQCLTMNGFVRKPFQIPALLDLVNSFLAEDEPEASGRLLS